jgi:hypothetical protein
MKKGGGVGCKKGECCVLSTSTCDFIKMFATGDGIFPPTDFLYPLQTCSVYGVYFFMNKGVTEKGQLSFTACI